MKRCWIIRGVFLALLLLCVGAWVWTHRSGMSLGWGGRFTGMVVSERGELCLMRFDDTSLPFGGIIFQRTGIMGLFGNMGNGFLGFMWGNEQGQSWIALPFWFLTSVLALILIYVWRKTRPKPNPATAFPVETGKVTA